MSIHGHDGRTVDGMVAATVLGDAQDADDGADEECPEDRGRMAIGASMVRLSVGVEHYEDIIADVEQALGAV